MVESAVSAPVVIVSAGGLPVAVLCAAETGMIGVVAGGLEWVA